LIAETEKEGFHIESILDRKRFNNGKLGVHVQSHPSKQPQLKCPECGSQKLFKDGLRYLKDRTVQRWLCRNCGYRFSESRAQRQVEVNVSEPTELFTWTSVQRKQLNNLPSFGKARQVCVAQKAKNLAEVEIQQERAAGATKIQKPAADIINFLWYMKKQGYAESTIKSRVKLLKRLVNLRADLHDPEGVKKIIATQAWCEGRKANVCDAYTTFLEMLGREWAKPRYKSVPKLPFIPQESEIDQLIAGCSSRMACFLQLLKETGMRPGEAWRLLWIDIDTVTRTVRVTPEKRSNPRIFHISAKLTAMLESLPRNYGDRMFSTPNMRLDHHSDHLRQQRKRIAHKLKNPRILRITFKTFRHWKGTMEYHRTKDLLHVKQVLGHKNVNNTLIYITLAEELFKDQQEYMSKIAQTVKEACALVNAGFEYVTGEYKDGGKIFRKPKY
jgi:integrase/DNA-directed RNA polymerase subunit RPC12/RpoP